MIKLEYPAVFRPEKVGYSVRVPDMEGCFTQGDTIEEAIEMTIEAMELYLEDKTRYPYPTSPINIPINKEKKEFFVMMGVRPRKKRHKQR